MTSRSAGGDEPFHVLRVLQSRARVSNLARLGRVADTLNRLDTGTLSEADRRRARDLTHQIVGSAGTFGYPYASQLASRLEEFFRRAEFDAERRREAREWLSAIQADLEATPSNRGDLDEE